jgi:hypothetical protein
MKSMSITSHGIDRLNWVWRWRSGRLRTSSPEIHILAGENVCIQATTPTHAGAAFASRQSARIPSASVTTDFVTTRTGIAGESSRAAAMRATCSATVRRMSGP